MIEKYRYGLSKTISKHLKTYKLYLMNLPCSCVVLSTLPFWEKLLFTGGRLIALKWFFMAVIYSMTYFCWKSPQSVSDVFSRASFQIKFKTSVINVTICMPSKVKFSKIFLLVLTRMFFQIVHNVRSSFPESFFQK